MVVSISRSRYVSVRGIDKFGKAVLIEAEDVLARVLQHEIDHLYGRLIIDYLFWYNKLKIIKSLLDN